MPGLFEIPKRAGRQEDAKIARKSKASITPSISIKGTTGLMGRIALIKSTVDKVLGAYKTRYQVIQDEEVLERYIDSCIKNGVISIDTETSGLDPMLDQIAGICIYTPGEKSSYIPLNHVSYITNEKVPNQLPIEFVRKQFQRVADSGIDNIMFNAKFDIRVMRNQVGVDLKCTWDCYLAARLLNENEGSGNNGLKKLHQKYVLDGVGDAFSFGDLFGGIPFTLIPINVGYVYAAHDPEITYELYEFQKPYLTEDDPECKEHDLQDVAWVFHNIEMPCVPVVADMEDAGIELDMKYAEELSVKYNSILKQKREEVYQICDQYANKIEEYQRAHPQSKLENPVNISSPTQLAILLYDVIGLDAGKDKVTGKIIRGTGESILKSLNNPLCDRILEYRAAEKLVKTYIDKLPNCVNPNDGRIHCSFNQYGADTGRFSSSDPNLQNIPSHNKDIRKMFKATDGYVLMSSDYSQQEPKVMTQMCGDPKMIDAYNHGKDLYVEIASLSFHKPYEECLEFRPDGTTNKEGKERRTQAKSILLGRLNKMPLMLAIA